MESPNDMVGGMGFEINKQEWIWANGQGLNVRAVSNARGSRNPLTLICRWRCIMCQVGNDSMNRVPMDELMLDICVTHIRRPSCWHIKSKSDGTATWILDSWIKLIISPFSLTNNNCQIAYLTARLPVACPIIKFIHDVRQFASILRLGADTREVCLAV